jgi:chromodomain-helicase-DNA-binding protein 4
MPSSERDFSSESEDADELVADLLQKFSSIEDPAIGTVLRNSQSPPRKSVTRTVTSTSFSPSVSAPSETPAAQAASKTKRPQTIAVEVPPLPENAEDYEFLPGHSTAWRIWGQKRVAGNVLYEVELATLERQWVSMERSLEILALSNSPCHLVERVFREDIREWIRGYQALQTERPTESEKSQEFYYRWL